MLSLNVKGNAKCQICDIIKTLLQTLIKSMYLKVNRT